MHITGVILAIIGGVLLFCSALALSFVKREEKFTRYDLIDLLLLSGTVGFLIDLFHGMVEGWRNRTSSAFPLLMFFAFSLVLVTAGISLMLLSYI